ncbi:MAG TPA: AraC family transcriptional regulator [Polyangiaceae bacterium]
MSKRLPDEPSLLATIAAGIARWAPAEGETATAIPGLSLLRIHSRLIVGRGLLRPSVCIVAQGEKVAQAGNDTTLRYRAGQFLATSIEMPLAGRAVNATSAKPYLAAALTLTSHDVFAVMKEAKVSLATTSAKGRTTFVGECDARLLDVLARMVNALDDERDARFLAPMLRRELIYRLVMGPSADAIRQSALLARADDGLGRAVDWIRDHYKDRLDIGELARFANMSTSSLHHKFKTAVSMGPLQYQKALRLEEARRLMLVGSADATRAAFEVGYESSSQFTREYHRRFGLPPGQDLKRIREGASADASLV